MKKVIGITGLILLLLGAWVGVDLNNNSKIVMTLAKDERAREVSAGFDDIMMALEEGREPDYSRVGHTFEYLNTRYDTADFRLPSIIRVLYGHDDKLPPEVAKGVKQAVTGFKYWMDQPGDDSMCYWSENHQILFSSAEYLLGHYYQNEWFTNMGIPGHQHREMGKARVLSWLEQRFRYGFTEWYSSTYYVEDIAPLAVLIDFAPDEEIRVKASMVMDLLIYDLATQNYQGTFTANSGRMYTGAKMSGRHGSMRSSIAHIWPEFSDNLGNPRFGGMQANFRYIKNYQVPEVLRLIGSDQHEPTVIRASNGVNLSEYRDEGLLGLEDHQIMMQLASEAFTNPEVIGNTLKYIDNNGMFTNEFLNQFTMINLGVLKSLNLAPMVSRLLEPVFDGTAIQRANTYMYRTPDYAMSTAQAYHPGMSGDQHNLFSLNINNDFNIFNQHPAKSLSAKGALSNSPNYWVGNGIHPHTVQEKNVNLTLWVLPEEENPLGKAAGLSRPINYYTHAYFPQQHMDEVIIDDRLAFGRIGDVYVALVGKNSLAYNTAEGYSDHDLLQQGKETYWITEVGTLAEHGSFADFQADIRAHMPTYNNQSLKYRNLELSYLGDFRVDGQVQSLEYPRFDAKYSQTARKADVIRFDFAGESLVLDFDNLKREF